MPFPSRGCQGFLGSFWMGPHGRNRNTGSPLLPVLPLHGLDHVTGVRQLVHRLSGRNKGPSLRLGVLTDPTMAFSSREFAAYSTEGLAGRGPGMFVPARRWKHSL